MHCRLTAHRWQSRPSAAHSWPRVRREPSGGLISALRCRVQEEEPGDVIYTGTVAPQTLPDKRKQLRPGDVVEVEIENIGVLRNTLVPMKGESTQL